VNMTQSVLYSSQSTVSLLNSFHVSIKTSLKVLLSLKGTVKPEITFWLIQDWITSTMCHEKSYIIKGNDTNISISKWWACILESLTTVKYFSAVVRVHFDLQSYVTTVLLNQQVGLHLYTFHLISRNSKHVDCLLRAATQTGGCCNSRHMEGDILRVYIYQFGTKA
jgi:hypothetical protein